MDFIDELKEELSSYEKHRNFVYDSGFFIEEEIREYDRNARKVRNLLKFLTEKEGHRKNYPHAPE